jgi:hypothetical protein
MPNLLTHNCAQNNASEFCYVGKLAENSGPLMIVLVIFIFIWEIIEHSNFLSEESLITRFL